jgi:hypothetical protein
MKEARIGGGRASESALREMVRIWLALSGAAVQPRSSKPVNDRMGIEPDNTAFAQ